MGSLAIILFVLLFLLILKGYPVALTLGGVSALFALGVYFVYPDRFDISIFTLLPSRFMGVIENFSLMAIPLFVFMGVMLEKSGLAESLLDTMAMMFGKMKGGLAISVVIVGTLLAASTGIVGATVVTMGLISLPTMIKRKYNVELATGVIVASGTLGQIIPPSIVLVLLADTISSSSKGAGNVDVGSMFSSALFPGIVLSVAYILYIILLTLFKKDHAPAIDSEDIAAFKEKNFLGKLIKVLVLPGLLIVAVLGSIMAGIASPTEAAAIGALGATLLAISQKKFSLTILKDVAQQTSWLTAMVFLILFGATTFTLVFRAFGGDDYLHHLIVSSNLSPNMFLFLVMFVMFVAGFFIDFIEIIFIIVPVVTPIFNHFHINMLWVGILMAINLQTSFLTPPFGFALFYLKGICPKNVTTAHIYRGAVPFILIQLIVLVLLIFYPGLFFLSR